MTRLNDQNLETSADLRAAAAFIPETRENKSASSQLAQTAKMFVEPTDSIGITQRNLCNDFSSFLNGYINSTFELVFGAFFSFFFDCATK